MSILLSVMTPVYNGGGYIQGCIDSATRELSGLEEGAAEYVVCDNHSTDGSSAVIQAASSLARIVSPPEFLSNRTTNWSFGLSQCEGEWFMMLHADDQLEVGSLHRLTEALRSMPPDVGMVFGRHRMFDNQGPDGDPAPSSSRLSVIDGPRFASRSLSIGCPFPPFVIFRASIFHAVGGFDDSRQLTQDWDLWNRILAVSDLAYVPLTVGRWRSHPYSSKVAELFAREHLQMASELAGRDDVGWGTKFFARLVAASKARWFCPHIDWTEFADLKPIWTPSGLVAKVVIRLSELYQRALNHLFRAGGESSARAFGLSVQREAQ